MRDFLDYWEYALPRRRSQGLAVLRLAVLGRYSKPAGEKSGGRLSKAENPARLAPGGVLSDSI
jgi:hypothetical protein